MNSLIQLKKITPVFLIAVVLVCFALLPRAQAVLPTPDGFYPNDNTAEGGTTALFSLTTGAMNTALGVNAMFLNTTGSNNTAVGDSALKRNTSGKNNTATGIQALFNNTSANNNTANGNVALFSNTTGPQNTATGTGALFTNVTGGNNTADGFNALRNNSSSSFNVAVGSEALFKNTGPGNTAVGNQALFSNTIAGSNSAFGSGALFFNTMGFDNTAIGTNALESNISGSSNTAVGEGAGDSATGDSGVFIGISAGGNVTTVDNVICIGAFELGANVGDSCFIANISGVDEGGTPLAVTINGDGQLGTAAVAPSSRRFKRDIKPMDKTSEVILALKPVTFRYNEERDPQGIPQFGLVAEDVEKVNPDLITRDRDGKPYTVRYDAVNAMLLNEFLKEHRTVQELKSKLAKQEKNFRATAVHQQKQIEALTAGLQRVSAQLEVSRPAPQTVLNQ